MEAAGPLRLRDGVLDSYRDVLTPPALETIAALAAVRCGSPRADARAHRAARAPPA